MDYPVFFHSCYSIMFTEKEEIDYFITKIDNNVSLRSRLAGEAIYYH